MSDPGAKRRRGRPTTFDKAAVANLAMHAYWQSDPTHVSLNAICKAAGVSKPSVYREFGSEDGLTFAALERYAEQVLGQVLGILGGTDTLQIKLQRVAYMASEDSTHDNGCLFVKMRAAKTQMGDKTKTLISTMDAMAIGAYEHTLQQASDAGQWSAHIPVKHAAEYLHAQIGLALDRRARGEDPKTVLALALSIFERE